MTKKEERVVDREENENDRMSARETMETARDKVREKQANEQRMSAGGGRKPEPIRLTVSLLPYAQFLPYAQCVSYHMHATSCFSDLCGCVPYT